MLDIPSPSLIGVVHLPALPGSPTHQISMGEIAERAIADAQVLQDASFDALIIENYGDMPFFADEVPPATVAAMAVIAEHVSRKTSLRVGLNVLRNDARSALGIAAAVGASFIRVNVHMGVSATDQGIIEGRAAKTLRQRKLLGKRVAILADVLVKHAAPLNQTDIAEAARDAAYRGLADGLIITGSATGRSVDIEDLKKVRESVPDRRVFVGSGATAETVAALLEHATGIIVGTAIKENGDPARPIDQLRANAFARAAGRGRA